MKVVKTYEAACEITGDNPNNLPDLSMLAEPMAKHIIADIKLDVLMKATNGKWVPNFSVYNQAKYIPWLEWVPSLGRFVYTYTYCTHTFTLLGARFCFPTRETAREFAETHIDLINDLMKYNLAA